MKKLLSISLCIGIIFSMFTFVVNAETSENFEYTVSNNEATITKYTGSESVLEIPSEIDGYTVTTIGLLAFGNCKTLTSVTLPNSVVALHGGAFSSCTSLVNIKLPNSISILGGEAFINCISLTSVAIPTSVYSIGGGAFKNCKKLSSVTIPNGVKYILDNAFENCESLTDIDIPNSVTNIGNSAFCGCKSINNLTVHSSVKDIGGYAFGYCFDRSSGKYLKNNDFIIKCYKNSAVEKYAKDNGFNFILLDKSNTKPTASDNKTSQSTNNKQNEVAKKVLKTPKAKFISGKKQFKIKYTKVKNAVGFQVRYKIKGKWKIKTFNTKKSATKVLKELKKGKYKVQIRSFSKGKKLYSNWTKVKTVKVK